MERVPSVSIPSGCPALCQLHFANPAPVLQGPECREPPSLPQAHVMFQPSIFFFSHFCSFLLQNIVNFVNVFSAWAWYGVRQGHGGVSLLEQPFFVQEDAGESADGESRSHVKAVNFLTQYPQEGEPSKRNAGIGSSVLIVDAITRTTRVTESHTKGEIYEHEIHPSTPRRQVQAMNVMVRVESVFFTYFPLFPRVLSSIGISPITQCYVQKSAILERRGWNPGET